MKYISLLITILTLFSCSENKVLLSKYEKSYDKSDSLIIENILLSKQIDSLKSKTEMCGKMIIKNDNTELIIEKNRVFEEYKKLNTFSKFTMIYSLPDTNSTILDTFPFCSSLISRRTISNQNKIFYEIIVPELTGYVLSDDMAKYEYHYNANFVISEFPNRKTIELRQLGNYKEVYNSIKQTYQFSRGMESYWQMKDCAIPFLKNVKWMFNYQDDMESCPGIQNNEYVLYTNEDKLLPLYKTQSLGESGYYVSDDIYIPIKFGNGKIQYVKSADINNIFNNETGDLKTVEYPSWLNIPKNELIIVKSENGSAIYKNDDSEYYDKMKIKKSTKYFRWDGQKITLVKEVKKEFIEKVTY